MIRLSKLIQGWLPLTGTAKASDSLYSGEQMRRILDRERMRSDRGNSTFVLLTLTFASPCDAAELATMAKVFHRRLRVTDDAGLLEPSRLGVVLPETSCAGAWKLAGDICDLLPAESRRPACDVYAYPTHDDSLDAAPNETARNGATTNDTRSNGISRNGALKNGGLKNGALKNGAATNGALKNGAATNGAVAELGHRHAHSMQALFVQPLPTWKRVIDVVGASIAVVVLSPILLLVALAIKLTSRGPIIFRQKRDTIGGRQFTIYKFRTMSNDAEQKKAALRAQNDHVGPAFKIANDPRVTSLGRLLRKASVDELPQLFNVLKGDMTLVGPRPLTADESVLCETWHKRQLDVTAGLTCIWQVRGRCSVAFSDRIRMDIRYIRSRSPINDLKLLAQTFPAVLLRRGAY